MGPKAHAIALACALATAACANGSATAGGQPAARPPSRGSWRALVRDDHRGPDKPWRDMDHEERKAYMRDVVVPVMSELFLAYDAEAHADFGCRTCHGQGARDAGYTMPNGGLFTLFPSGTPEQKRTVAEREAAARFMFNAVTPTMRRLLGQTRFDPEKQNGFSCFACHPQGASDNLRTANIPLRPL